MGPAARLIALSLPLALLTGASIERPAPRPVVSPRPLTAAERGFLQQHWRRPIPPQGEPPANFSALERSLSPPDCGSCHPVQFGDWKTGFHAKSMGPGIAGQLVEMRRSDPRAARSCPACHAPLAEQAEEVGGPQGFVKNPVFDAGLRQQGIVCAGCHVRGYQRFGPPRRDGTQPNAEARAALPHGGFTATTAFLRSEFCAGCHQFSPEGFALNGKLLENTFEEWRASRFAKLGRQCQDCHMPDRRHLWRGIHDPEMVKSGLRITFRTERGRHRVGDRVQATLIIENIGVGHYFPTYVTPRVLVETQLVDGAGQVVAGSLEQRAIGRDVPVDLSRELADTRIPPGGRFTLTYARRLEVPRLTLRITVTVFPDHFYTGFFEALLAEGAGDGEPQIREALEETRRSSFVIWSRDLPLT